MKRSWGWRLRRAAAILVVVALADAIIVEPRWVERTRVSIHAPLKSPLHVLHITDLHGSGLGTRERAVLRAIDEEKPDVVVLTGDTVDSGTFQPYAAFLGALHAPLGVYAVAGNWEHWRPAADEDATWSAAGIVVLRNEARRLRDDVWVVGFDDSTAGSPDVERALASVPPGVATLALFHSPILFERLAGRVSVALAGHTHGGQVRLPLVPPLWLPQGSGRFVEGKYEDRGSMLYVSRGVGTSIAPVRFFCRPEVAVVEVAP